MGAVIKIGVQVQQSQDIPQHLKKEKKVFFLLLVCWLPSLITARGGREPARLVQCQKLEKTLLTGEETSLSAFDGDESGCLKACQIDELKECVGASIGGRGQKCLHFKTGYEIQNTGRGMRAWTSYTCCRGRGCP